MDARDAHRHSSSHRAELERSGRCGCFYCLATFPPEAVADWLAEPGGGETARCPRCGIDSVIGDASGAPVTEAFLGRMRAVWFGGG